MTLTLCLSHCPACRFVAELPGKMAPLLADVEATKVCTQLWHAQVSWLWCACATVTLFCSAAKHHRTTHMHL